MQEEFGKEWVCYILRSTNLNNTNKTYVGCTINVNRRLRQHNGIIKGGARSTCIGRPYICYCIISGFENKYQAYQCEWLLKHPTGKKKGNNKYYGINGRIQGLNLLLSLDKWQEKFANVKIMITVDKNYALFIENAKNTNVILHEK